MSGMIENTQIKAKRTHIKKAVSEETAVIYHHWEEEMVIYQYIIRYIDCNS